MPSPAGLDLRDLNDFAALVEAAVGTGTVRHFLPTAVRTLGEALGTKKIVRTTSGRTFLGMASLWIRHLFSHHRHECNQFRQRNAASERHHQISSRVLSWRTHKGRCHGSRNERKQCEHGTHINSLRRRALRAGAEAHPNANPAALPSLPKALPHGAPPEHLHNPAHKHGASAIRE